MNTQNRLLAFLVEIVKRLKSKSPRFFLILQYISAGVTAVTGLPEFLTMFSISLPSPLNLLANRTVAICGVVSLVFAKLPIENPTIAVTADGAVVKKTDENKLPFTAQSETKAAQDKGLQSSATLTEVVDTTKK